MQITRGSDYAILGLLRLAQAGNRPIVMLSEIAEQEDLPESYLAKVFQALTHAGLVRSRRGVRGGFALARAPESITLKQIIEAVEGPIALSPCLHLDQYCRRQASCVVRSVLADAEAVIAETFARTTLADMLAKQAQAAAPVLAMPKMPVRTVSAIAAGD